MVIGLSVSQRERIKRVMLVVLLMEYHNNIRERTYLLRAAVVHPSLSPWRYLYDNGNDTTSFLHLTGVIREAFNILRDILFPPEPADEFGRQPRGRPKILDNTGMGDPPYSVLHLHRKDGTSCCKETASPSAVLGYFSRREEDVRICSYGRGS